MKIALAGNPNSGKSTLFNNLTRLNQKVGNWTGVTIEQKSGKYYKDKSIEIIDLPGVYSLVPYSEEEKVTSQFLNSKDYDVIINLIDSTNLERNLVLTMQMIEKGYPVVLALNMEDELRKNGIKLDVDALKKQLGVNAVLISALKNANIDSLIYAAKHYKQGKPTLDYDATQENEVQKATDRHHFIEELTARIKVGSLDRSTKITDTIDKIVTNKWLAFPIFAVIIWLMYFISIQTVGALCQEGLEMLFNDIIGANISRAFASWGVADWITSLLVDGIIGGVGAVLSFVPQIIMLFTIISLLESSGYMARVAFIMDRIFKKIGLSGKSFIPMIVGCGCSVPAIMATKTIENRRDRHATVMLTPFIPCSAKLPIFAMFAGIFFPENAFVAPSMYFLGITIVVVGGLILNRFRKTQADDTFIIEMPLYRMPAIKSIVLDIWEKVKGFLVKAGTIIFAASIIIWLMQGFNFKFQAVDPEHSMLAMIGKSISWVLAPLGFGNWQSAVALLTGIAAKEIVVSTFGILVGDEAALAAMLTPQAAYAFMAFVLLASPCVAAIGATRSELGSFKLTALTILFQTSVAYVVALLINQAGNLLAKNIGLFVGILVILIVALLAFVAVKSIIAGNKGCSGCKCKQNCANCKPIPKSKKSGD